MVFKADIGAAIDNTDACQNRASLPQPQSYGGKARFCRRFDESLLVELDVVAFADAARLASGAQVLGMLHFTRARARRVHCEA